MIVNIHDMIYAYIHMFNDSFRSIFILHIFKL